MKLLEKNSPKGKLSKDDLKKPLNKLLWALVGVVAVWLSSDLPDAIGGDSNLSLFLAGLSYLFAETLWHLKSDYSNGESKT